MKFKKLPFICVIILALSVTVYAHPGRTDANGGHYDKANGTYHYHHGYEAHQHANGVCPFDYVDDAQHTSGILIPDDDGIEYYSDNGQSPHEHPNGVCPYRNTSQPERQEYDTSDDTAKEQQPVDDATNKTTIFDKVVFAIIIYICLFAYVSIAIFVLMSMIIDKVFKTKISKCTESFALFSHLFLYFRLL